MLLGAGDEDPLEGGERGGGLVDRPAHPEAEIGRHLVVARAGGVEAPGGGADQLPEPGLDMHVDVLERRILRDSRTGIFVLDPLEPLGDAEASASGMIPCFASIAAWASEAAISSRQSLLSKPIEALISRISAAGPPAKRPPHIRLEPGLSSTTAGLLSGRR